MIQSKKELKFYIMADRMMNRGCFKRSAKMIIQELILPDYVMRYLIYYRKRQYYSRNKSRLGKICWSYYQYKIKLLGIKLGFYFGGDYGYGLVVPHWGTIVAGGKVGNYAVLHTSICIVGSVRTIGDGLYVSTGAKIVGEVALGNNVTIAPNSVVSKNRKGNNLLLDGSPAEVKRENYPVWYMRDGEVYDKRVNKVEELKKKMGL